MKTFAERLDWAMRCAGLNPQTDQSELARRVGGTLKAQSISSILRGEQATSKYTPRIAFVLGCDATWLADGDGKPPRMRKHETNIPDTSISAPNSGVIVKSPADSGSSITDEPTESSVGDKIDLIEGRPVAIIGEIEGGSDGYISVEVYSAGDRRQQLPKVRSRDVSAYGLKVRGDSMRPRMKSGEYIVIEPNVDAQPGDDVVVMFTHGKSVVRELLWIRDGDVCLGSVNSSVPPMTVALDTIESMHRVAAIMPRGSAIEVGE